MACESVVSTGVSVVVDARQVGVLLAFEEAKLREKRREEESGAEAAGQPTFHKTPARRRSKRSPKTVART